MNAPIREEMLKALRLVAGSGFRMPRKGGNPARRTRTMTGRRIPVGHGGEGRVANTSVLPTSPGRYRWDAWGGAVVDVYTKSPRSRRLFVTPPGRNAVEVPISPWIAGKFTPVGEGEE